MCLVTTVLLPLSWSLQLTASMGVKSVMETIMALPAESQCQSNLSRFVARTKPMSQKFWGLGGMGEEQHKPYISISALEGWCKAALRMEVKADRREIRSWPACRISIIVRKDDRWMTGGCIVSAAPVVAPECRSTMGKGGSTNQMGHSEAINSSKRFKPWKKS